MRSLGIVRPVDPLGRITLPVELRRVLDIAEGDLIDISKDGNTILLNKCTEKCIICGAKNDLSEFRDKMLCQHCVEEITEMMK